MKTVFDAKIVDSDEFMREALELDGRPFATFGKRTRDDDLMLSGAQLFRARLRMHVSSLTEQKCKNCGKPIVKEDYGSNGWRHSAGNYACVLHAEPST